jgi:hypothetical protein
MQHLCLCYTLDALSQIRRGVSDFGLLYVVSEETDHSGMKKANELGLVRLRHALDAAHRFR